MCRVEGHIPRDGVHARRLVHESVRCHRVARPVDERAEIGRARAVGVGTQVRRDHVVDCQLDIILADAHGHARKDADHWRGRRECAVERRIEAKLLQHRPCVRENVPTHRARQTLAQIALDHVDTAMRVVVHDRLLHVRHEPHIGLLRSWRERWRRAVRVARERLEPVAAAHVHIFVAVESPFPHTSARLEMRVVVGHKLVVQLLTGAGGIASIRSPTRVHRANIETELHTTAGRLILAVGDAVVVQRVRRLDVVDHPVAVRPI